MKVELEEIGDHGDGPDAIVVRLDDGTEVWANSIVDDPEGELRSFARMLGQVRDEATASLREKLGLARAKDQFACESPPDGCECSGCWLSRKYEGDEKALLEDR